MSKKLKKSQRRSLRDRISKLRRSPDSGDQARAEALSAQLAWQTSPTFSRSARKFKERSR